jgi:ABC-type transport system substrate-binding protein
MSTRSVLGGVIAGLVLGACTATTDAATTTTGIPEETGVSVTSTAPSTTAPPTTTSTIEEGDTIPLGDIPPLALYLAAIDRGLIGTAYAGDVYLDPDGYVNVGRLFCSLLEADVSPSAVLESYVAALEAESASLSDDDLVLGGVILGASVQLICPDFIDALATDLGTGTDDG